MANPHPFLRHDEKCMQLVSILSEDMIQALDLYLKLGGVQTEEDYAFMGEVEAMDQFSKISIVGDEDAPFALGNRKNLCIFKTWHVVSGNSGGVVPKTFQVGSQSGIGAFVHQKLHTAIR